MNKSKSFFTIFLIGLLSLSIIVSGCSNETPITPSDTVNQVTTEETADLSIDEEIVDADIGELDDLEVSDNIPLE